VVAISAHGDKPRQEVLDAGANCFIAKPLDIDNLLPKLAFLAGNETNH
jgi:CheY-like chemotaxis protein